MVVPGLHQARERDLVETSQIDAAHLRAERGAGGDHIERAASGTALGCRVSAQGHRRLHRAARDPAAARERSTARRRRNRIAAVQLKPAYFAAGAAAIACRVASAT